MKNAILIISLFFISLVSADGHLKSEQDVLASLEKYFEARNNNDYDFSLRKSGSAALDLAYVACGRLDGYFQKNLNIWDIAAGIIIIKEAGGKINNIDHSHNEVIRVLAGSNSIYEKMIENLNNF